MMNWKKTVTLPSGAQGTRVVPVSDTYPLPVTASVDVGDITAETTAVATAAAPSYPEGDPSPLSQTLDGKLRVEASVSLSSVAIDQSTPGTTNAVDATNFPDAVDVNSGSKSNSTLRVVIATDQPQLTNALKVDGSAVTQPVSGTFWQATQPVSASSLPLPTGASTETTLAAVNTVLGAKTDAKSTATDTTSVSAMQVLKQISASVQAPPSQAVTNAGTFAVQAAQSGTWNIGSITTLPALVAGTALIGYVGHGKTIKTVDVNITADTDIIAAVTSKRIKVIAYSFDTTGTNANEIIFKSNGTGGTALGRCLLQSQSGAVFGRNVAVAAPSFLFATAASEKLTLDVSQTDAVKGFITYFDDDAT